MVVRALIGAALIAVAGVGLVCMGAWWLWTTVTERVREALITRDAERSYRRHVGDAIALTRPRPAPSPEQLRGDAALAIVEAELDATYAQLADLYLT